VLGGFGSIGGVVPADRHRLVEQLLGGYVGRDYKATFPFILMLLVIALRPQGLFGAHGTAALTMAKVEAAPSVTVTEGRPPPGARAPAGDAGAPT
jgi:hypothetical protein